VEFYCSKGRVQKTTWNSTVAKAGLRKPCGILPRTFVFFSSRNKDLYAIPCTFSKIILPFFAYIISPVTNVTLTFHFQMMFPLFSFFYQKFILFLSLSLLFSSPYYIFSLSGQE
jgi:hypothetical protein